MKTNRRELFALFAAPLLIRLVPPEPPKIDLEEFSRLYIQPAMLALANELDARILEKPPVWLTNSHRAA